MSNTINHEEARQLAELKPDSNLARCYLDMLARAKKAEEEWDTLRDMTEEAVGATAAALRRAATMAREFAAAEASRDAALARCRDADSDSQEQYEEDAARIKALEGERDRLLVLMGSEVDRNTLKLMSISANASYQMEKDRAEKAEAREARMREALVYVRDQIGNTDPNATLSVLDRIAADLTEDVPQQLAEVCDSIDAALAQPGAKGD